MDLHHTIKNLRRKRGIRQERMAAQLHMARSTYSKLESGSTAMPYDQLVRIAAILEVPVYGLIQEDGGLFVQSVYDKFSLMLHLAYHTLSCQRFSVVPYEQLNFVEVALLAAKGFVGQAAYENTPLGGRIYEFGPKQAFTHMIEQLGMQVLFDEKLIQEPHWLQMWQQYQDDLNNNSLEPILDMDEQQYLTVYMIALTMPDGSSPLVQLAEEDFPQGTNDAEVALAHLTRQTGATDGQILAVTYDGYAPGTEIVKCR
jgi:transcriptional regulator with XRE-family HTH domain